MIIIISLIERIFDLFYLLQLVSLFYFNCCNYNCVARLFVVQIVSHLKTFPLHQQQCWQQMISIDSMFCCIITFMPYDYLIVHFLCHTAGKQGSYINILHIITDDHCVFLFLPVGMYTYLNIINTHSDLVMIYFVLQRVWNIIPSLNFMLADI